MTLLQFLLAAFKVIPVLKNIWDELVAEYVAKKIEEMKRENREAIKKAINDYDQRELEKALGNPNPGEHSGLPGTVIVDELPGVPNPKP